MEKYLFTANIFARLSEIVEADSEKEVMDTIRNQKSFEIKQDDLNVYPASIEITKIKEKKEKNNMELKETVELMNSEDYKERFVAEYHQVKIRYEKLKNFCNKIEVEEMLGPFDSFKSFEEAKRAALQFAKKEAIKTMKELTYIINFIDE